MLKYGIMAAAGAPQSERTREMLYLSVLLIRYCIFNIQRSQIEIGRWGCLGILLYQRFCSYVLTSNGKTLRHELAIVREADMATE